MASVLAAASLTLNDGQSIGIFGDSGSGKTTLARAVLRLLPAKASCTGAVLFRNRDLFLLSETELRQVRGSGIALISQEPAAALCPVRRIEGQIRLRRRWPRQARWPAIWAPDASTFTARCRKQRNSDSPLNYDRHQVSLTLRDATLPFSPLALKPMSASDTIRQGTIPRIDVTLRND